MNPESCRGPADEVRTICEDVTYGYVRDWMRQRPGAPVVGYLPVYVPRELAYAAGGLAAGVCHMDNIVHLMPGLYVMPTNKLSGHCQY